MNYVLKENVSDEGASEGYHLPYVQARYGESM